MKRFGKYLRYLLLFIVITLFFISIYIKDYFTTINFETLLYYLNTSLEGTSNSFFVGGFKVVVVEVVILLPILILLLYIVKNYCVVISFRKIFEFDLFKSVYKIRYAIDILLIIVFIGMGLKNIQFFDFLKNRMEVGTIYEDEYVKPNEVNIDINDKRNLILIYVESLEQTDFSIKNGGYRNESLIPELELLYEKNEKISDNFNTVAGASWTTAGMFASMSGVPYKISFGNEYKELFGESFLPGTYMLGDLLKENGYNLSFVMGSDAVFGSRDLLLNSHGNYNIIDLYDIMDKYDYKDNTSDWGINDNLVFEVAKDEIIRLSKESAPFNVGILTADTHPLEGYFNKSICKYNDNYSPLENAYRCNSLVISNFIGWVKSQDFYKNTTIVILGDHLAMYSENLHDEIPDDYNRSIYNVFINSKVKYSCDTNYKWTTFDLYPTILASMGASIEGDRLGLGTNLFACKETLASKYEFLDSELGKGSNFYDKCLMNKKCD